MNDTQVFDIRSRLSDSVIDIFETMLSLEVTLVDEEPMAEDARRISGNVGFAGGILGMLRFEVTNEFSQIMTAEMLGMEVDDLEGEDEVKDVILELCNMVAGNLKSAFNDHDLPCVISSPSLTAGTDFDIDILNMARYERLTFRCGDMTQHYVLVEVCVKPPDDALPEIMQKLTSIDISKFGRLDIISTAGDTLIELFDVMLSMRLEVAETAEEAEFEGDRIVGSVNFAGDVRGVISIVVQKDFARITTGKILDQPLEQVQEEEEVKDAIGEICNIVAGNLKSGFCDTGLTCEISVPTITAGKDFKIEVRNMARYERFSFQFYEHKLFVEVCVKIDERVLVAESVKNETEPLIDKASEEPSNNGDAPSEEFKEAKTTSETAVENVFPELSDAAESTEGQHGETAESLDPRSLTNLDFIMDIPVEVSVGLGNTRMKIHEVRQLKSGNSIVLDNIEDDKLEIFANNQLIAKGEVVVEKGKYGIRVTEVVSRMERIRKLK